MRYLESENPYIIARFTTGDTVKISIYKLSDNSKIVDNVAMTEIGTTGYFKYQFNPSPTTLTEYLYIANNTIEEHAGKIILGGYPDSIKDQTDKMNFTGTDIKATLDGEEVTTDSASRIASRADVSALALESTVTQYENYKATGFSTHTPLDVRTELEGEGTKLTAIKDKTDTLNWDDITKILQIEQGKWKIQNNQMIFYDSDGVTPILTFNLKDKNGNSTETEVFERDPV